MIRATTIASMALGLVGASLALGQAVPFTETFDDGSAGWLDGLFQPLVEAPSGGFDGSPFVAAVGDLNADAGNGVSIFRALPTSSGGAFTGNYIAGGIDTLTLDVMHDVGQDVQFFVRFAGPANFPGAFFYAPELAPSGEWTTLSFDLNPSSPLFGAEGDPMDWPGIFDQAFSNVGNIQVVALKPDGFSGGPSTFSLDQVSIIPAPGAAVVLTAGALAGVRRRRA
jgi:hypothetical protein